MRELKFRAYIKPLKRYATGIDIIQFHKCCDVEGAGIWTVVTANEGIFEFDDIVIEQYTGLKDKNGKEIYEGDIVKAGGRIYEVAWFEKDGGWFCFRENDSVYTPLYHLKGEVIGNIHENPELLEEE